VPAPPSGGFESRDGSVRSLKTAPCGPPWSSVTSLTLEFGRLTVVWCFLLDDDDDDDGGNDDDDDDGSNDDDDDDGSDDDDDDERSDDDEDEDVGSDDANDDEYDFVTEVGLLTGGFFFDC